VQQQEEEEKPLTSTNPVLELELAEEKLPMTLSRQEVKSAAISKLLQFAEYACEISW